MKFNKYFFYFNNYYYINFPKTNPQIFIKKFYLILINLLKFSLIFNFKYIDKYYNRIFEKISFFKNS